MKRKLPGFIAGMVTMAVIGGVTVTALAATGSFTITVDPVNIQVNGQVFAPKDVKGNDVPVFAYNGTTYAPVRALGEAYGLSVGYDGTSGLVAVTHPAASPVDPEPADPTTPPAFSWTAENEALYQEFKGMWNLTSDSKDTYPKQIYLTYTGETKDEILQLLQNLSDSVFVECTQRFALEISRSYENEKTVDLNYKYGSKTLWTDTYYTVTQTIGGVETNFNSRYIQSKNYVLLVLG